MNGWKSERIPGTEAGTFIQWKGTNLCMDFHCPCGVSSHADGGFAYFVRCPACESVFELGTQLLVRKADPGDVPVLELE